MRKLIVSINISLDGCIAGPDNELDWHFKNWTPEMGVLLCEQLLTVDTIILGRVTYEKMAGYWPVVINDAWLPREDYPLADLMNRYTKIVFSKKNMRTEWNNSTVIHSVAEKVLPQMKKEPGKDMVVLGSAQLVESLLHAGLIDQLNLWIHPVLLKKGRLLFTTMPSQRSLRLIRTHRTDSGVMVLYYEINQEGN